MPSNEKDEGDEVKLPVSLRDWFAGQALMSMLAPIQQLNDDTPATAAKLSYAFADAMLAERAKEKP